MTRPPAWDTNGYFWTHQTYVKSAKWECGYCGSQVASSSGYAAEKEDDFGDKQYMYLYLCPHCNLPTLATEDFSWHFPSNPPGTFIEHVPPQLAALYDEARAAAGANAHTAAVMVCRIILMNIAVDRGAKRRQSYEFYISYLFDNHYLSPDGKQVADYVKRLGNDANHKIILMNADESRPVIRIIEALFRQIYELPRLIPSKIRNAPPVDEDGEEIDGG